MLTLSQSTLNRRAAMSSWQEGFRKRKYDAFVGIEDVENYGCVETKHAARRIKATHRKRGRYTTVVAIKRVMDGWIYDDDVVVDEERAHVVAESRDGAKGYSTMGYGGWKDQKDQRPFELPAGFSDEAEGSGENNDGARDDRDGSDDEDDDEDDEDEESACSLQPHVDNTGRDVRRMFGSYWTLDEQARIPLLVEQHGTDWEEIAKQLETKTALMVENYFRRPQRVGQYSLNEIARVADERKARGEPYNMLWAPSKFLEPSKGGASEFDDVLVDEERAHAVAESRDGGRGYSSMGYGGGKDREEQKAFELPAGLRDKAEGSGENNDRAGDDDDDDSSDEGEDSEDLQPYVDVRPTFGSYPTRAEQPTFGEVHRDSLLELAEAAVQRKARGMPYIKRPEENTLMAGFYSSPYHHTYDRGGFIPEPEPDWLLDALSKCTERQSIEPAQLSNSIDLVLSSGSQPVPSSRFGQFDIEPDTTFNSSRTDQQGNIQADEDRTHAACESQESTLDVEECVVEWVDHDAVMDEVCVEDERMHAVAESRDNMGGKGYSSMGFGGDKDRKDEKTFDLPQGLRDMAEGGGGGGEEDENNDRGNDGGDGDVEMDGDYGGHKYEPWDPVDWMLPHDELVEFPSKIAASGSGEVNEMVDTEPEPMAFTNNTLNFLDDERMAWS